MNHARIQKRPALRKVPRLARGSCNFYRWIFALKTHTHTQRARERDKKTKKLSWINYASALGFVLVGPSQKKKTCITCCTSHNNNYKHDRSRINPAGQTNLVHRSFVFVVALSSRAYNAAQWHTYNPRATQHQQQRCHLLFTVELRRLQHPTVHALYVSRTALTEVAIVLGLLAPGHDSYDGSPGELNADGHGDVALALLLADLLLDLLHSGVVRRWGLHLWFWLFFSIYLQNKIKHFFCTLAHLGLVNWLVDRFIGRVGASWTCGQDSRRPLTDTGFSCRCYLSLRAARGSPTRSADCYRRCVPLPPRVQTSLLFGYPTSTCSVVCWCIRAQRMLHSRSWLGGPFVLKFLKSSFGWIVGTGVLFQSLSFFICFC